MNMQIPNFALFYNRSERKKSQKQAKTRASIFNKEQQKTIPQLPETQFPTPGKPVSLYVVRQLSTQQMLITRIGFRVRQYSRIEQDYICYMVQVIMMECSWLKIFIIEPNILYIEMNCLSEKYLEQLCVQHKEEQFELQNRILNFLRNISEELLNPWFDNNLIESNIISTQFNQESFIENFTRSVIAKIKDRHILSFNLRKNGKSL